MSAQINSSGSAHRFSLAGLEKKEFEVQTPGGCLWNIELIGEIQQNMIGTLTGGPATVGLYTSEDAIAWNLVGAAQTVVAGGQVNLSGRTGRYARIISTDAQGAFIHVHARASARVQPLQLL